MKAPKLVGLGVSLLSYRVSNTPDSVSLRCDNHFSKRPTWSQRRAPVDRLGLAPCGVCLATFVAKRAVRSYRTLSPLPLRAVCFLLYFPSNGDMAPPFRLFKRRTALWSPEVPPPAPESAGSDCLGYSIKFYHKMTDVACDVVKTVVKIG